MADPILFVSMDGKGVKSSIIRAHAARKGHQRSRANQLKAAQAAGLPPPPAKKPRNAGQRAKKGDKSIKSKPVPKSRIQDENVEEIQRETQVVRAKSPNPAHLYAPVTMSERFVKMFFETMKPSYTAAYGAFGVPNIIMTEWPLYMNHETFLWTEAAAIQGLHEHLTRPGNPPSPKVFSYKKEALKCLRRDLLAGNGRLDDYLVMSLFVLAALDLMAGDDLSHNAHKKILRTAFNQAGGLHTYGSFVRNTTMRLDSFWRSTADEPKTPEVPLLLPSRLPRIPQHPFSSELSALIDSLPTGFRELALQQKIPLDILEVLSRIADPSSKSVFSLDTQNGDNRSPSGTDIFCTSLSSAFSSSSRTSSNPNMSPGIYVDFWESCPSLSSTPATALGAQSYLYPSEPPLERLLSLALLIYSTNRDAANPLKMYNCITNGALYDLAYDLPQCVSRRTHDEELCLFWIWSVTVEGHRDASGRISPVGAKLLDQQQRRWPGLVGSMKEERILQRFWFRPVDPYCATPDLKPGFGLDQAQQTGMPAGIGMNKNKSTYTGGSASASEDSGYCSPPSWQSASGTSSKIGAGEGMYSSVSGISIATPRTGQNVNAGVNVVTGPGSEVRKFNPNTQAYEGHLVDFSLDTMPSANTNTNTMLTNYYMPVNSIDPLNVGPDPSWQQQHQQQYQHQHQQTHLNDSQQYGNQYISQDPYLYHNQNSNQNQDQFQQQYDVYGFPVQRIEEIGELPFDGGSLKPKMGRRTGEGEFTRMAVG